MAKDNFDLRSFLIENKMTVTSRGNEVRKHFLLKEWNDNWTLRDFTGKINPDTDYSIIFYFKGGDTDKVEYAWPGQKLLDYISRSGDKVTFADFLNGKVRMYVNAPDLSEGCGHGLEERKAGGRKPFKYDIDMPAGINEAEDVDVDIEDDDFVDPAELPEDSELLEGTLEDKKRRIFDRLGIDQESFNRFVQQAVNVTRGSIPKVFKLVKKAYPVSDRQIRFLVDKGIIDWTKSGFGATGRDLGRKGSHGMTYSDTDSYTGQAITEDFADIANLAAREQERYADAEADEEEPGTAPDVFGGLGSTSYEAPEDFSAYDEESIRRSYTGLKNQGISDERAVGILAKSYDIPEDTIRAMFRTELGNIKQKAVQVDEPKDRVSTFRMPKRTGSAAEKAAMKDMAGEFDDDEEDSREFVKPGETDEDEPEAEEGSREAATGTIKISVDGKDLNLTIPENFSMDETEADLVKRLQGYRRPAVAIPYLQRALNAAQKAAANVGSGKIYMYLCSDGAYHTYGSKVKLGDTIPVEKRNGNVIDTKITQFVASIDCSGAPAPRASRGGETGTVADSRGYGSIELSDSEIQNYVQSKAWNAKSIEQKLRDEYFPWSEEAKEYMDDDEIAAAKAELKNEAPVDPESDWAKVFTSRR